MSALRKAWLYVAITGDVLKSVVFKLASWHLAIRFHKTHRANQ